MVKLIARTRVMLGPDPANWKQPGETFEVGETRAAHYLQIGAATAAPVEAPRRKARATEAPALEPVAEAAPNDAD